MYTQTYKLINYLIMGALNQRVKYTECAEGSANPQKRFFALPFV